MSVRDTVLGAVQAWAARLEMAPEVPEQLLAAYRAEVLAEAGAMVLAAFHGEPFLNYPPDFADLLREAGDKTTAPAATAPACAACHQPFDPTGWRYTDQARHRDTPFCRACVDRCHDSESADHRCPVCRAAEEKTTAAAAAVTPQPTAGWHAARALAGRLDRLLDLIRAEGGEWRTGRVHRIYRATEDAPQRVTARRDLEALHALGWLERHTAPGDCFYTLSARKGGGR